MPGTWSNAVLPPLKRKKSRSPHDAPDFLDDPDYAKHPYGIWREFDDIRTGRTDVDKPIDLVPTGKKNGTRDTGRGRGGT